MKRAWFLLGAAALSGALAWRMRLPPPVDLKGKVVVITGASSGIGRAAARAFAAEGAHIALVARRTEALREVEASLRQYDSRALVFPADVTDETDLQELVETVIGEFGQIDVLVNNAGVSMGGWFQDLDPDEVHQLLEVNLFAPLRLTQIALPWMLERGTGHLVYVSSVVSELGSPGQTAYVAAKGGINALASSLRRELSGKGIDVSVIMPGWVKTEMSQNLDPEQMKAARLLGPGIVYDEPETIARFIVDAVKYRKREVTMGGIGFTSGVTLQRLSPELMDLVYKFYYDKDKMIEVISKQGL